MKQKVAIALLSVVGLVGLTSVDVLAQTTPTATPTSTTTPTAPSALQVRDAALRSQAINVLHHINSLEIQEAQQAQGNLQSTASQTFAQTLITDHQANEQQVLQLAAQQGIAVFAFQPATYETALDSQLTTLSGTTLYDQAFAQGQVLGHERALQNVQLIQGLIVDPQIRTLLNSSITMIQKHRDAAIRLAAAPSP